eukprot:UN14665
MKLQILLTRMDRSGLSRMVVIDD